MMSDLSWFRGQTFAQVIIYSHSASSPNDFDIRFVYGLTDTDQYNTGTGTSGIAGLLLGTNTLNIAGPLAASTDYFYSFRGGKLVGSTPPPPREDDWRARVEAGLAPSGGERFLVVRWHEHVVTVSPSEQGTLRTLGAYRTIAAPDLATHRYDGDRTRFDREVRRLVRHGWVRAAIAPGRHGGRETPVLTLTRDGAAFARQHVVPEGQALHWGLVKPKEQQHDAAIYRMAMAETERLARGGR